MPKAIKKRIVKKKRILEEEEVKTFFQAVIHFVTERKKNVSIAVAISVFIVAVLLIYYYHHQSKNREALTYQTQANQLYEKGSDPSVPQEEKNKSLKSALENYQKAIQAKRDSVSMLSLGNVYYQLAEYEKAVGAYNDFIRDYPKSYFVPMAYQKIYFAYLKKGDVKQAEQALKDLKNYDDGLFKDTVLIREAQRLEDIGDKEKAIAIYKDIVKQTEKSPWYELSKNNIDKFDLEKKMKEEAAQKEKEKKTSEAKDDKTQSKDKPKTDAKDVETQSKDKPKTDAKDVETQSKDKPKTDAKDVETQSKDKPKTDAKDVETQSKDKPKTDAKDVETQSKDKPKTDAKDVETQP
jgi:tetratricopeptide (TPR) repeat protein